MYDSHIFCPDYKSLKSKIADIINGEDGDIDEIAEQVQALYDDGKMSSTQYDELLRYIDTI